jgi:ABC-type lipoprotein release transport system permease subunit
VLGLIGARLTTGALASLLFEITPQDLPTFVAVGCLFSIAAALACAVPARRAARIDPAVTLRAD